MLKGPVTLFQQFMMKFYRREKLKIECLNITGPRLAGLENKTNCYSQPLWQTVFFFFFQNKEFRVRIRPSTTFRKI